VEGISPDNAALVVLLARWPNSGTLVSFSRDGALLATTNNGALTILDAATGSFLSVKVDMNFTALSPDWSLLATYLTSDDHTSTLLWNAASGQMLRSVNYGSSRAVFSPDGKTLALYEGMWQLWDTANGNTLAFLQGDRLFANYAIAFSPDGETIVTTYQFDLSLHSNDTPDGNVQFWNVARGANLRSLHVTESNIMDLAFSPDGKTFAVLTQSELTLWDWRSGTLLKTIDPHNIGYHMAFSPNGKLLAVGGDIGIGLMDISTGAYLGRLKVDDPITNGLVFSPDGTRLATSSSNGSVSIWGVMP
jgi:WD40 repeat protein